MGKDINFSQARLSQLNISEKRSVPDLNRTGEFNNTEQLYAGTEDRNRSSVDNSDVRISQDTRNRNQQQAKNLTIS